MRASPDTSTILIVCPHCLANNDESACLCHRCLTPLKSHAEIDPMYRIYSEWNGYRKAIARPTRLITVIGMYLIFGPGFMAVAAGTILGCIAIIQEPSGVFTFYGIPFILAAVFAAAQIWMYGTILYRVTKNYRYRPADEADDAGAPDNLREEEDLAGDII